MTRSAQGCHETEVAALGTKTKPRSGLVNGSSLLSACTGRYQSCSRPTGAAGCRCFLYMAKQVGEERLELSQQVSKAKGNLGVVAYSLLINPVLRRARQEECHEFKTILGYTVSSRTAWAQYETLFQKQTKEQ